MSRGHGDAHVSIRHMVSIGLVSTGNVSNLRQESAETTVAKKKLLYLQNCTDFSHCACIFLPQMTVVTDLGGLTVAEATLKVKRTLCHPQKVCLKSR